VICLYATGTARLLQTIKNNTMYKIITVLALLFSASVSRSQITQVEFQAAGVTCSMCSKAINKALLTLPFISDVRPDLQKNMFTVTFKDSAAVNLDDIRKKVEGAGFFVGKLWLTVNVTAADVKNDAHIQAGELNLHFMNVKTQQLNGAVKLRLLDKGFTTAKEYKKNSQFTKLECYKTGYMQSCCTIPGEKKGGERIFHVTI
jgi:copper chaperone CopZ